MTSSGATLGTVTTNLVRFRKRIKKTLFGASDELPIIAPQSLAELPQARVISQGGPIFNNPDLVVDKLWSGFSRSALQDLEAMLVARERPRSSLNTAAWSLANWYAVHGDYTAAQTVFEPHLDTNKSAYINTKNLFLAVYCAMESGNFAAARRFCEMIRHLSPNHISLPFALANANAAETGPTPDIAWDQRRLELVNTFYKKNGIAPLRKKDADAPLCITNLSADITPSSEGGTGPKVSIIVPVYNGAKTLENTLDGLLAQSWINLEILVVDDCSTDCTAEIIAAYKARDPRVVALRTPENFGSYTARNLALSQARGDLITVHDANDWSHPQKIALQATHMAQNQDIVANHTHRARVDDNLIYLGKFRYKWRLVDWDPSSFMIRSEAARSLGGWDPVRISADSEFIERARQVFGTQVVSLPENLGPLSFAYVEQGSLTSSGPTHGRTIHHGVRREYGESSRYWRSLQSVGTLALDPHSAERPFPVPGLVLPRRELTRECKLLLVADFNAGDSLVDAVLERLRAHPPDPNQMAFLQWRYYALDTTTPLISPVRDMVHTGLISHLIPGETMQANRVLVLTPDALSHPLDNLPSVQSRTLEAVFDRLPIEQPGHPLHAPLQDIEHQMYTAFGTMGRWYATSEEVRSGLAARVGDTREITLATLGDLLGDDGFTRDPA